MTPTAKKRARIYRKAAESIFDEKYFFCCKAIVECSRKRNLIININDMETYSFAPEFFLFKPDKLEGGIFGGWWKTFSRSPRILALLFAEQMALDEQRADKFSNK